MVPFKEKFLARARQEAEKSQFYQRVGAVIVRKNRVIAAGFNRGSRTHPLSTHPYRSAHAETDALRKVQGQDLSDCTIYVCRISARGKFALAKPCVFCQALLASNELYSVVYTLDEARIGYLELSDAQRVANGYGS